MPEATLARFPRRIVTLQQDRPMSPHSLRRHIPISLVEGVPTIAETLARIRPRDHFMSQCEIYIRKHSVWQWQFEVDFCLG